MKKLNVLLSLTLLLGLTGCSLFSTSSNDAGENFDIYEEQLDTDVFTNRDYNEELYYTQSSISLVSGQTTTVTEEGTYTISGNVTESQILIDTEDKVQLVFNNVTITNTELACLYIKNADKVFVQLQGTNTLSSDVTNDQDDKVNGVIFSRDDLTFNGNGTLNLTSSNNGIVVKDDLVFTNGTYVINTTLDALEVNDMIAITNSEFTITTNGGYNSKISNESSTKGIKCDDFIYIKDGTFDLNCYDDAIHSDGNIIIDEGNISIYTGDDAITTGYSLTINGGNINVENCYEGYEAQRITINDGNNNITCTDDGMNARKADVDDGNGCYININGGTNIITTINGGEADGLDSNGDILITGGYTLIHGTTDTRDTPLDYDGSAYITGGTFLTTGSYSITQQNFNSSNTTQGAIAYQISSSSYTNAGTIITLKDSSGNTIVSYTAVNKFQIVHISHEDIKEGETYTLYIGSTSYTIKMSSITYSNFSSSTGMPGRP